MSKRAAASLLGAFLSTLAAAVEPDMVSVTLENDFFAGQDQHYTSGIQAAYLAKIPELPSALRALPPFDRSADARAVFAIGQRTYTPADTDIDVPNPRDRPYAGWLYVLTDVRTRSDAAIDYVTASVGIVGPGSLARQGQDEFHRRTHEPRSKGWGSQLHDEPTLMVAFERSWPSAAEASFGAARVDVSPRTSVALGTPFTYGSIGAVARAGHNLPDDIPTTHVSLAPSRDGFRGARLFGWYAWAGLDARAVAWNTFLDGNAFRESAAVKRRPFGYDLQFGVAAAWRGARLGFAIVHRSREFEGQGGGDKYGQLTLAFAY